MNKTENVRGEDPSPLAYTLKMRINKNLYQRKFDDYLNSIDMWLTENCEKKFSIHVISNADYDIPMEMDILFEDPNDAAYFKLGPLWEEEVN